MGATGSVSFVDGTLLDSTIIAISTGANSPTTGFAAVNNATVINSNITANGTGSAYTNRSSNVLGVNSAIANVYGSTLNINASGDASGNNSSAQAFGIRANSGQATVTGSFINVTSTGNASLASATKSSSTNAIGVIAVTNAIVTSSNINAKAMGSANSLNSFAQSFGVQSQSANTTVTDSTVNALSTGNAFNEGITSSVGILAAQIATTTGSTVTAKTTGNSASNSSFARAYGIQTTSGNLFITNSIVSAITTGTTTIIGDTSATGVSSGSSLTFQVILQA